MKYFFQSCPIISDENADAIETVDSTLHETKSEMDIMNTKMGNINMTLNESGGNVNSLWAAMNNVNLTLQNTILNVETLDENTSKYTFLLYFIILT